MAVYITFTGQAQLIAKLSQLAKAMPDQAAAALYQEAELIMAEAKRRTPVDTGALRGSGHVVPPAREGLSTVVHLAYGGAGAINRHGVPVDAYAVHVHEDLEAHHPVGEAKFLERPLTEAAPYLAERVAMRMRRQGE